MFLDNKIIKMVGTQIPSSDSLIDKNYKMNPAIL